MNLARQALPGKGGNSYRVPEGRLKTIRLVIQSSLRAGFSHLPSASPAVPAGLNSCAPAGTE